MAAVITLLVLFLVTCDSNPINRGTNQETDNDCYGTECFVDIDYQYQTDTELLLPENLTDVITKTLPSIADSLNKIASSLNKSTNHDTMMALLTNHTENQERIADALEGILSESEQSRGYLYWLSYLSDIEQDMNSIKSRM